MILLIFIYICIGIVLSIYIVYYGIETMPPGLSSYDVSSARGYAVLGV